MKNILRDIVSKKKEVIKNYKKKISENQLLHNIKNIKSYTDFTSKIQKRNAEKKISIIAEIKKKSPSAGTIIANFNPLNIAKIYIDNGAAFLSVLTEENFFSGKLDYIQNIKNHFSIPILCKDFFIDTYQVPLAKSFGADCILIILSALDKSLAQDLYQAANQLQISTIVEVHTEKEAEKALLFENSLIGINNRNLDSMEVNINNSIQLSKILSVHKKPLICESGISTPDKMRLIIDNAKIYNFLIGESLLKSKNIGHKLREFTQISL
jgi:indole-3-glycerol phosphate synthase